MKALKPKKSLGQNFLTSKEITKEIINISNISNSDVVLEIGPGRGFLTEELLKKGAIVIAIEKDDRLIEYLNGKFSKEISTKKLILIHEDILALDFKNKRSPTSFIEGGYKVVANIPYYITGQILRMFLESEKQPERMVLMLQKEVVERIIAKDEKESILSISVKAYGDPNLVKIVPAKYFNPKPKVDSAILLIKNISKKNFTDTGSEKTFFKLVKQGFLHKRKTLLGNLKLPQVQGLSLGELEEVFDICDISPKIRAEKLGVKDWICIQNKLFK